MSEEKSFSDLFEASQQVNMSMKKGDKVSGEIIDIQKDTIFVDLGGRQDGIVDAKDFTEADIPQLTRWLTQEKKVKALGEIGLDYYYDLSPREIQKTVFERQLDLAYELKKPVILHIRDAHGDTIEILRAHRDRLPHCVVHCCSASWESAKIYLSLDCMISFAGPVTFKKSVNLQEVAKNVPLDRLMIETDSPYLAPEPVRGHRNEPLNVGHICRLIAALRQMDAQQLCDITRENGRRFYGIG